MTEQENAALVEHASEEIEHLEKHISRLKNYGDTFNIAGYESQLARQKIALAALTAEVHSYTFEDDPKPLFTTTPAPAIPEGWQLVPVEPTEDMVIDGFESAPSLIFSDPDDWKEYQNMSGCRQAAHRAKLCWAAMLAAAPNYEEANRELA